MTRLLWILAVVVGMAGTAEPEFLDQGPLSIPLERLVPGNNWKITLVNPGVATDAHVQLSGSIATALSVEGTGRVYLAAGGTATIVLVPGPNRQASTGQLVLTAPTGIDRRQIAVVGPSFLARYRVLLMGAAALLLLAAGAFWWRRRRSRQAVDAPGTGEQEGQEGFTHNDEPSASDLLNRAEYVQELAQLAGAATPPMVIGVFGEWGTGKTSLLMQVRELLQERHSHCAHVWFDPWPHQHDVNPVLPLLHTIVTDLGLAGRADVRRTLRTISEVLGSLVLTASLKLTVGDVRKFTEAYDESNFRARSERTRLDQHLSSLIGQALAASGKKRLIVFIDDLDRCEADHITSLLEALKIHFNRNNCVFFLAVAEEPLIAAVRVKYGDQGVDNYLDKIVQFPFWMPRLSDSDFHSYVDKLLRDPIKPAADLLKIGLAHNPRAIKRFINVLILQDRVARARVLANYDISILAAVLLIRDGDREFYRRLADDPTLLKRIEEDLETAENETLPDWGVLPLRIVRCFLDRQREIPTDVSPYIDLVKASPTLPADSEITSAEQAVPRHDQRSRKEFLGTRSVLADRVNRQVKQLVEEDRVLAPLLCLPGEDTPRPLAGLAEIIALWDEKMLLAGTAGVGKTVLAARIAQHLLEQATNPDQPIPVFLRLRLLRTDRTGFELSLTHALVGEYRIPLSEAFAMVTRGRLIYILDGLDEVEDSDRLVDTLLSWQNQTGAKIIMTARAKSTRDALTRYPSFDLVVVHGIAAEEAERRLRNVLAEHGVDRERLALPAEVIHSPEFLATLTTRTSWISDLPTGPVDFIKWYADWARSKSATAEFTTPQISMVLQGLARHLRVSGDDMFSSEDPLVRSVFRRNGVIGVKVSSAMTTMIETGLLREVSPKRYRFVHPLLAKEFAGT
ncbi:P-loop NTPase fold protein [Acrocarpospora sp. B8E8]|uniref:P-loop NTPase fold protein n=1 Tax=Acrocarpospora sp. B8E8 TaxID=3153572 RepID=UPI00325D7B26